MIKRLSRWLVEHGWFWSWDEKQGIVHLWSMLLTIAAIILWHFKDWNWQYLFQGLAGIVTFGLPILALLIAAVKRKTWEPWFVFPAMAGMVIGSFVMMAVALVLGWV